MKTVELNASISVPAVDGIHAPLIAFAKTSGSGPWQRVEQTDSTGLELRFRRGNWSTSIFGMLDMGHKKSPDQPSTDSSGHLVWASLPMSLRILLRPSPIKVLLLIRYRVFYEAPFRAKKHQELMRYFEIGIFRETEELRLYLQECLCLTEPPPCEYGFKPETATPRTDDDPPKRNTVPRIE